MKEKQFFANQDSTRHPALANPENVGLVVVDVQEKFIPAIPGLDGLVKNIVALVRGFREFELPVVVTEQYSKGLGRTVPEISEYIETGCIVEKMAFSAMQEQAFTEKLASLGIEMFAVCGIEAHICVHQTVHDMLHKGYKVWVPADAVGSRTPQNHRVAMNRMERAGAIPTSTEMLLFEMLMRSGSEGFRKIQSWIK